VIALNEYELLTNSPQLLTPCSYFYIMDGTTRIYAREYRDHE
jgi:hypothetical protein